jgi:autotransporter-associated beta strand protein
VGTLNLSGSANTFTGGVTLSEGVLEVATLGDAGLARTVTTTASSAIVTVSDTTGLTDGMTFAAASLPAGAMIVSVDSPTQITISDSATTAGASVAASFGASSSLGLGTSASSLVFNGGALRYAGATATTNRDFTINAGKTARFDIVSDTAAVTFSGVSGASTGGLEKLGAGELVLAGVHGYTGPTKITAGTLALGAGERIADASVLVLGGGTLDLNGFSETLGGLDLDADATIVLGGASNVIAFGDSAALDWGDFGLNIISFNGGLAPQSVRFGTSSSGLSALQLGLITVDGMGGYVLDTDGYLTTAIPEPSAFAVLAGLGALGVAATRRRRVRD